MNDYAHPEVLVTTDWVAEHAEDPNVVLVEVNVDTSLFEKGHIQMPSAGAGRASSATPCSETSSPKRHSRR